MDSPSVGGAFRRGFFRDDEIENWRLNGFLHTQAVTDISRCIVLHSETGSGRKNRVARLIEPDTTHIGVATDHVVESVWNDLYPGYKTSEGVPQELLSQFPVLEEALEAMGVVVWPMVYYEAD